MKYFYFLFFLVLIHGGELFAKDADKKKPKNYFRYNIIQKSNSEKSKARHYKVDQNSMYRFSQKVRDMKLPKLKKFNSGSGRKVYDRYKVLFGGMGYKVHTETMSLDLHQVRKPASIPKDIPKEISTGQTRVEAFYKLNNGDYKEAYPIFWRLATSLEANRKDRQRDALFTGVAAQKAGLENVALMAYLYAIKYGLGRDKISSGKEVKDKKYLRELLRQVSKFKEISRLDMIVRKLDSRTIASIRSGVDVDPIFFSLLKQRFYNDLQISAILKKKISPKSPVMEKMQLFQALAYAERGKTKQAASLLKELLSSKDIKLQEQARINLARLFAQSTQYDEAIRMYRTLPEDALNHLDILLEIAWLEFKKGDYGKSLGKSVGLRTSFFRHAFLPELYILEAYNRKRVCDFGGALRVVKDLKKDYVNEIRSIRKIAMEKRTSPDFSIYTQLKESLQKKESEVHRYERYLLQLPIITNWQTFLYDIEQELMKLRENIENSYNRDERHLLATMEDFYRRAKKNASIQVEASIYNELRRMDRKILALFREAKYLNMDVVISAELNHSIQLASNYPELPEKEKQKLLSSQNMWPMEENEIWEDEIAWLEVRNQSKCADRLKKHRKKRKDRSISSTTKLEEI